MAQPVYLTIEVRNIKLLSSVWLMRDDSQQSGQQSD